MESGKKFLKVKIKNLAAEAKIIRKEEIKLKFKKVKVPNEHGSYDVKYLRVPVLEKNREVLNGLNEHRTGVVRDEARHSLTAYAFLRNRPYSVVKPKDPFKVSMETVKRMVRKYGPVNAALKDTDPAMAELLALLKAWYEGKPVRIEWPEVTTPVDEMPLDQL